MQLYFFTFLHLKNWITSRKVYSISISRFCYYVKKNNKKIYSYNTSFLLFLYKLQKKIKLFFCIYFVHICIRRWEEKRAAKKSYLKQRENKFIPLFFFTKVSLIVSALLRYYVFFSDYFFSSGKMDNRLIFEEFLPQLIRNFFFY